MPTVNLQLLKIAAIIAISAIGFGYDQTWYTGALGQVFFNLNYGSKAVKTPIGSYHVLSAVQTSTAVAVSYVFQVIGLVLGSHVIKVKGRRMGLLSTSAFVIVGVVIEMTGTIGRGEYWVIIAGKWFASIGLGQMLGVGPLYLAECAPSGHRGAMVNTTAFMVTFGSFLAGVANYGVSTMPGTQTGLRILLGVQFIPPILALATIPLLPESPRWLIEVGRLEEAKTVLTFLRSTATREEVDAEVQRIDEIIHLDRLANKSSWADLFRGSNLMRTLTVLGVMCISQANGLAFLSNYALLYLQAVGIKNLFVILMILYGVVCASTCAGFWTQDYFGRRPLMMVTGIVGAVALIALGALTTAYPAPTGAPADAAIALIFIWFVVYATGWSNVPYTLTSELPADHLRPKTWAVAGSGAQLTGMIIGLVNPYIQDEGYGDLKGKVAFIYGAVGVVGVVFVYLLVPELKGKSLNEVNWLYANNVRPRKMGKHTVPVLEEQDTAGSEGKGSVRHMENGA